MNEQTRYRLTGAIFLLSIGIIVLPMVFDGEGVRVKQLPEFSEPLPPMPSEAELKALEIPRAEVEQHLAEQEVTGGLLDDDGFQVENGTRIGDPVLRQPQLEEPPEKQLQPDTEIVTGGASGVAQAVPALSAPQSPSDDPESASRPVESRSEQSRAAAPPAKTPAVAPRRRVPAVTEKSSSAGSLAKQAIWAVQLASFASPVNAVALRDRLLGDGFEAWTSTARGASGVRTRVAIGPLLDRDDADRMRTLVSGRYNVNAIVVHMEP